MRQQPDSDLSNYSPAEKLRSKVALITGGDSGIGRAVAMAFAMEAASSVITFDVNEDDAADTKALVEGKGGACLPLMSDVRDPAACAEAVARCISEFGRLDILVNN